MPRRNYLKYILYIYISKNVHETYFIRDLANDFTGSYTFMHIDIPTFFTDSNLNSQILISRPF